MTPDERALLTNFLRDLDQARGGPKDPDAESLINRSLQSNPDAAYLLVQHCILADQALHAAQARIRELQSQGGGASSGGGGGFLGGGSPWSQGGPAPQPTAVPTSAPPPYGQAPYGQAPYGQPQGGPFSTGGGLGSFLRNAGTTAAGVAGGEMLFEGLSGLFGGHHGYGGGGMFGGGFGGAPEVENVTINEYGDDRIHDDDRAFSDDSDFGGSDWSDDGN
jgi:hypothetical protein